MKEDEVMSEKEILYRMRLKILLESIEELQVDLDNFMEYYNYQIKISESIRGKKMVVEKNLTFVYDSVINEVKIRRFWNLNL